MTAVQDHKSIRSTNGSRSVTGIFSRQQSLAELQMFGFCILIVTGFTGPVCRCYAEFFSGKIRYKFSVMLSFVNPLLHSHRFIRRIFSSPVLQVIMS